jgi:hypothetical protein
MSKIRAIALLATGLAVLPAALGHADDIALNIASGLWEMTATPKMTGAIPDNLTADQRAKMEAAMAKAMAPRTYKECLTRDKLESAFQQGSGPSCQRTVLANSATALHTQEQCTDSKGVRQLTVNMQAPMPQSLAGTVDMVATPRGGKTITIHTDMQGKWVASDCAGVDAPQPVN